MMLVLLVLGIVGYVGEATSPLQLCTADEIHVERRYEMRAVGHVRCTAGLVLVTGSEAVVKANEDESVITIEVKGGARLQHQGDTIGGDRVVARIAHSGTLWWLSEVHVEYPGVRLTPATPAR